MLDKKEYRKQYYIKNKDKMNKSDKYTKEQKVEFSEMIQVRTEELKG